MGEMVLKDLRETLCMELEEIARKQDMNVGDLDTVHKLTDTIKNIDKIEGMKDGGYSYADGSMYSNRGNSYGRYSRRGSSYDGDRGGSSYARGQHYVRGHYSYSNDSDRVAERIEQMLDGDNLSLDDKSTLRKALDIVMG